MVHVCRNIQQIASILTHFKLTCLALLRMILQNLNIPRYLTILFCTPFVAGCKFHDDGLLSGEAS